MGWTGSILARELTKAGLTVVGPRARPHAHAARGFRHPLGARRPQICACARSCSRTPRIETVSLRHRRPRRRCRSGGSARSCRAPGSAAPATHWNGTTWRVCSRPTTCCAAISPAIRQNAMPEEMTIEDFAGQLRRAGAVLRPLREARRHLRQGRQPARQDHRRRQRLRRPAPERISQQAADARAWPACCSGGGPRSLGYHPFPGPSANMSAAYTNPEGVTLGACHIAASARGSAARPTPRRRRTRASCRCCCPIPNSSCAPTPM